MRLIGERLSVPATSVVAMTRSAIEAENLVKHFGDTVAVDGVSFSVPEGSVLGLLGPNGAGKTTTVRMMTTLTRPTAGTGRVAGHDILTDPAAVRRSMGLTGQAATVDELLTGRENLRLIGNLYGLDASYIRRASDELLERFSLADAGDRTAKTYSGGMRRRLDLAVSLIASPPVLFLDEPTTGLDPRSRSDLWEMLRGLVAETCQLLAPDAVEAADHPDVLPAGEQFVDGGDLAGEAHAAAHLVRFAADVVAGDRRGAAGGLGQRRHHPHGGGLACTVGAEQAQHRAGRNGEADPVNRGVLAEPLDQDDGLYGGCHDMDRIGAHRHRVTDFSARACAKCTHFAARLRANTHTRGGFAEVQA